MRTILLFGLLLVAFWAILWTPSSTELTPIEVPSQPSLTQGKWKGITPSAPIADTVVREKEMHPDREGKSAVLVVDHATLEPVEDAVVHVAFQHPLVESWRANRYGYWDAFPEAELKVGKGIRTTRAGIAWVPTPPEGALLTAWKGEAAGRAEILGKENRLVIALHPDPPIQIRAQRQDGTPLAGVQVGIWSSYRSGYPALTTLTDSEGNATLFAPRLHFLEAPNRVYRIGLSEIVPQESTRVPFRDLPLENILTEPPSSRIELRLVDVQGQAYSSMIGIRILIDRGQYQRSMTITPKEGAILLPPLPLDTDVNLEFDTDGRFPDDDLELAIRSPRNHGEVLPQEVVVPRRCVEIQVQAQFPKDVEARPWAAWVELQHAANPRRIEDKRKMQFDAEGRGTIPLSVDPEDAKQEFRLKVAIRPRDPGPYRYGFSAPFTIPSQSPLEVHLDLPSVGFKGTVMDQDGNPVKGATVKVSPHAPPGKSPPYASESAPTDDQGAYSWRREGFLHGGTAKVQLLGRTIAEQEIAPGQSICDFTTVRPDFIVEGRLTLPSYLDGQLTLVLDQGNRKHQRQLRGSLIGFPFQFPVSSQETCRLSLESWLHGTLAVIEEVRPWREGEEGDSRLSYWNLKDAFHLASVELRVGAEPVKHYSVDLPGVPPHELRNFYSTVYHPSNTLMISTEEGRRVLLLDGIPSRILVTGPEIQPLEVDVHPGHQVVQAVAGANGSFLIRGIDNIPAGIDLVCFASPVDTDSRDLRMEQILRKRLDFSRRFQVPGEWTLEVVLYKTGYWGGCFPAHARRQLILDGVHEKIHFRVDPNMGDFQIEIGVDPEMVASFGKVYGDDGSD